ncbi:sensor domain-containing diguanylate cyclase [Spirochaeta isovalerica]|uniref:diguanylate cyclase n=1 Tax=Spirochaeta isovalerica TaxID=150 RepID=A0A841RB08_9SPIO|nr:GGDEF domain-containing protein [Spirochaeta isovalerica]MBB6480541.1 diguanylate cyclase (GGDEF)-like protein [Spirochaeta isovalerica]
MSQIGFGLISEIFNRIDFGMILIDNHDKIVIWNDFVSRHCQKDPASVRGEDLFEVFPDLPRTWLNVKFRGVRQLRNISKVSWEQRPVLFNFPSGGTMLQDCDFIPVNNPGTDEVYICIIIKDVSESAKNKMELNELIKINKSLEEITNIDALTEVFNRRSILQALKDKMSEARDNAEPLYLCMFDLDHFKNINDTYGHIVGDRVLKYVSQTVSSLMKKDMLFGRYGGEEFMIILQGETLDDVLSWIDEVRSCISSGSIETREGSVKISASFGIAEFSGLMKDDLELIHSADVALYRAKKEGRNRIILYSQK